MSENRFDQMRAAMQDAEQILDAADSVAHQMASMVVNRLRKADPDVLVEMKLQLRQFNAQTKRWRR